MDDSPNLPNFLPAKLSRYTVYHLYGSKVDHLVLKGLNFFPKGWSPGGFQLQTQHSLDTAFGFTAPAAQDCLHQLTCLVNLLLLCKAPCCIAPWLCGAPVTTLHKINRRVRPIAVFETIRHLVSHICCLSFHLPDLILSTQL